MVLDQSLQSLFRRQFQEVVQMKVNCSLNPSILLIIPDSSHKPKQHVVPKV